MDDLKIPLLDIPLTSKHGTLPTGESKGPKEGRKINSRMKKYAEERNDRK